MIFSATRSYAIFLRQMLILRANPMRVIPYLIWAVLDIVLWGFITKYLNVVGNATFSFVPAFLGAVLLWDFLIRVQQGVTMPFLEDVWSKNFLNIFASPLTILEYLLGFVATSVVTSSIGLVIMVLLASVFGFSFLSLGFALVPAVALLFLFGMAVGIFGASVVLRFGPSAEWLVWPIPAVLGPFVGVFYPVSVLPQWMQVVSVLLPPSYVFESMRAIVSGEALVYTHLALGGALAILYIVAALFLFMAIHKLVIRNGSIARFEAEGP